MSRLSNLVTVLIITIYLILSTSSITAVDISEPLIISKPGSYRLTSDIITKDKTVFFDIRSSDVILDGNNHTIDRGTVPSSGTQSYGVKIVNNNLEIENISVKNIIINNFSRGVSADKLKKGYFNRIVMSGNTKGFFLLNSSSITVTMSDVLGGEVKSQSGSEGMHLENVKDAIITNNLIEKHSTWGIALINSKNITMGGNWIDANKGAGITLDKTIKGLIVNNYLNNSLNTKILGESNVTWNLLKLEGPNIVSGPYVGGNYWAAPGGKGFSEKCTDGGDGFCDETFILNTLNRDNLPLTYISIRPLPGEDLPPTDPDKDGLYEDLNGNGRKDYADVVLDFDNLDWIRENEPLNPFDFDRNGKIDYLDVITLFSDSE